MLSVGEWVDHIIMMPDYSSDDLLKTMETFFSKPEEDEEEWIQNTDVASSLLDMNDPVTMSNIEEVYVIKEEMKVEVVEEDELHLKDSQAQQIDAQNCKFCDMTFETYELKKNHEESYIDSEGEFMCESVLAQTKHMVNFNNSKVENRKFQCKLENCGNTDKNYLECGQGCGSKFRNVAPLKRHEAVCTFNKGKAGSISTNNPVAPKQNIKQIKPSVQFFSPVAKKSSQKTLAVAQTVKSTVAEVVNDEVKVEIVQEEELHLKDSRAQQIDAQNCKFCDMKFKTYESKKKHEESYIESEGEFMCESVLAQTQDMVNLNNSKVENKRLLCEFENCGITLKDVGNLKQHIKRYHIDGSDVKMYTCFYCTGAFKGRRAYFVHKVGCIGVPHNYKCHQQECTFTCLDERGMLSHFKKHHKKEEGGCDFSCEICGQSYTTTEGKNRHMLAHPGPHVKPAPKKKMENLPCPICGKVFVNKSSLTVHINAVHDEEGKIRFKCDQCSRGFSCKSKLKYHILSHSDERKHPCATCGKKFKSKRDLVKHDKIHSGVKPFKCSFCAKAFLNPDKVRRHELIHTGVMDYRCSSCGKGFNQKVNLGVHERKCNGVTEGQPKLIPEAFDPPGTANDIFPPSKLIPEAFDPPGTANDVFPPSKL